MDENGRESGHLMLITPERVFYAGLLGRPRERCPGAFHVYVALKGSLWLTTADGRGAMASCSGRAECAAHHCERLSLCNLRRDRAGKHAGTA